MRTGKKPLCLRHLYIKMIIIVPRQARDKQSRDRALKKRAAEFSYSEIPHDVDVSDGFTGTIAIGQVREEDPTIQSPPIKLSTAGHSPPIKLSQTRDYCT